MGAEETFKLHFQIADQVPESPDRIGIAALQGVIGTSQRGRIKRAVNTLVALDVLTWAGQRRGRAVCQGPMDLQRVVDDGLMPMPDREIATYPLLVSAVDEFLTLWHRERNDPVQDNGTDDDGVQVYITASKSSGRKGANAAYTRPDLTAVVDLAFPTLGPWVEVHAIEVKPYWGIDRASLFETAAQAALRRCTFSWLLAWIPDPTSGHFSSASQDKIYRAHESINALADEANDLGVGFIVTRDLGEDAFLRKTVEPRRQVLDPKALDQTMNTLLN